MLDLLGTLFFAFVALGGMIYYLRLEPAPDSVLDTEAPEPNRLRDGGAERDILDYAIFRAGPTGSGSERLVEWPRASRGALLLAFPNGVLTDDNGNTFEWSGSEALHPEALMSDFVLLQVIVTDGADMYTVLTVTVPANLPKLQSELARSIGERIDSAERQFYVSGRSDTPREEH